MHEEPQGPAEEEPAVGTTGPQAIAPEPATGPDRLDELAQRLGDELAGLRAEVAREHHRAAAREQVIDRLHEENQRLRAGERLLLLRPLLTDLQRLRHDLLRTAAGLPAGFDAAAAADMLRSYAASLELTLERGGVTVLAPVPGAAFDPATQRATGTVPAVDPGQEATVAEVVLDGYHDVEAGRTVVPAAVRVHRWLPDPDPAPAATGPEPASTTHPTPNP
ncbi:Protein GrpE [Micromonospora sp. MW-13]|uniref:nucleotide exchange factor GrpE n=1 Tax=unclassified Micromonospora TaxID=2617518 RepID=UPI000E444F72|nr:MULTISPECIES: nucleotide exchange factor GrpE [unclassified Micromonospora]MCX4473564.1 nucleotide exchange factor GrpE [Micromonospora sp. NBC_01655]RGC65772.1 Protein GrpE [Micromonospora sp. MW-13]